jgi:hypothetical protein
MRLVKRTYVFPPQLLEGFERTVPAGERSALVARLMQEWLETSKREQLRGDIIAGCREMAEVYRDVEREYHSLEEEVQHAVDKEPSSRRDRSRSTRSGRRV